MLSPAIMPPKELTLDEGFERLRKDGKNTIEGLVKIMKDAKIVGDKASEEAARKVLKASDDGKVTLDGLKEAMNKVAAATNKTAEEVLGRMKAAVAAAAAAVGSAATAVGAAAK